MKILGILLFIFSNYIFGQIPDKLSSFPVLIEYQGKSTGTGFFYTDSNYTYFITAKHVLFDLSTNKLFNSEAILTSYPRNPDIEKPNILIADMQTLLDKGLIKTHQDKDIAVVYLGTQIKLDSIHSATQYYSEIKKPGPTSRIEVVGLENIKKYSEVETGYDVFLFGYPTAIGASEPQLQQLNSNRPLLRKGALAGKNQKLKTYILDCPVYPGNSGGPVIIMIEKSLGVKGFYVIGIVTEFIPFEDYWQNIRYKNLINRDWNNSGLSVAVPIDFVLELIKQ